MKALWQLWKQYVAYKAQKAADDLRFYSQKHGPDYPINWVYRDGLGAAQAELRLGFWLSMPGAPPRMR